MIKKIFLYLACSLFADQPLIVGTNAEFPPFSYIENKAIVGFDIDVAKEVAQRLGKTIQIKDMPFDALIPDIALGHVDFVAAGMSYTEERAKRASFTKSYFEDPLMIFSKRPLSFDKLKGKKVVVVQGFTADLLMSSQKNIDLIRLPSQADGFLAIKSGRADAFVTAQYHTTLIEAAGDTCALAVPLKKTKLLAEIQTALDAMEEDGSMAKLKTKWKLL